MTAVLSRRTVMDLPPDPNPGPHHKIVPMDLVLRSDSVDDPRDVRNALEYKRFDSGYEDLLESIRTHGLADGYAPTWFEGYGGSAGELCEGHHRVAALVDLGAYWCAVQDGYPPWGPWRATDGSSPGACAHCRDCGRYG